MKKVSLWHGSVKERYSGGENIDFERYKFYLSEFLSKWCSCLSCREKELILHWVLELRKIYLTGAVDLLRGLECLSHINAFVGFNPKNTEIATKVYGCKLNGWKILMRENKWWDSSDSAMDFEGKCQQ